MDMKLKKGKLQLGEKIKQKVTQINFNKDKENLISKDEIGYSDVDKSTSYKKEEDEDEIEKGKKMKRKDEGKTNIL